jgi:hypothetical protein
MHGQRKKKKKKKEIKTKFLQRNKDKIFNLKNFEGGGVVGGGGVCAVKINLFNF